MPQFRKDPFVEKIRKLFSDYAIDFAEHLPSTKRGVLSYLQEVRREPKLTRNAKPPNVELYLDSVWMCELFTIEEFERQIPKLMRLLESHKSKRFLGGGRFHQDLFSELRSIKDNVHGTGWKNLNLVDLESIEKVQMVDYIDMSLQSFHGGHVVLIFQLFPTKLFKQKLQRIINQEYAPYTLLQFPNRKNLFRGWWGSRTTPGERIKQDDIQKMIVELKSSAERYLSRFIKGHFFDPKLMIPSVELWIKKEIIQATQVDEGKTKSKMPFKSFWDSVGFPENSFERYKEKAGKYLLYLSDRNSNDFSIKILADKTKVKLQSGYQTIDGQISHQVGYMIPDLISAWGLRARLIDFIDVMNEIRLKIYSKRNRNARRLFQWTKNVSAHQHNYKRIKKDMVSESVVHSIRSSGLQLFFQVRGQNSVLKLTDTLSGNIKYLSSKANEFFVSTEDFLSSLTSAVTIKANFITQRRVLWLSVFMALLAIVSIASNSKLCDFKRVKPMCLAVGKVLDGKEGGSP